MAACSRVIPDRVRCVQLGDDVHAVLIDGERVGEVRGRNGKGWKWTEQPDNVLPERTDEVDSLVLAVMEQWNDGTRTPTEPFVPDRRIPKAVAEMVRDRDQGLCQYCLMEGVRTPGTQIDHFIPVLYRGTSTIDNLQLACRAHNDTRNKWNRHP